LTVLQNFTKKRSETETSKEIAAFKIGSWRKIGGIYVSTFAGKSTFAPTSTLYRLVNKALREENGMGRPQHMHQQSPLVPVDSMLKSSKKQLHHSRACNNHLLK